ncbi:SDR family NAD(P)-dependent oxidoreductase [Bacteriovorax sp. DB6_IX]|uniref:SDR family NAD(P)-dependent oxidoreductase n=1 Tax=Bacteriovorax sp. DB6_IX TaxID=1353530 RepID=UPI00038A5397|nr:SDR family NAD(P)-dependent oxidoreductase [Bacteriovorax sp. DB6_IX]EQC50722.1 PF11086 family protein [Bacteriovorax sp. DB6_IX]
MILLKVVVLQAFWLFCVKHAGGTFWPYYLSGALLLCFANFFIINRSRQREVISFSRYLFMLLFFLFWGLCQDYLLFKSRIIDEIVAPYWLISLWVVFLCYYGDIFQKFVRLKTPMLSIIGAIGGALAYYSGAKLSGLSLHQSMHIEFIIFVAISWAIFFPLSLREFEHGIIWNYLLDKSVVFSFDRTGFLRHQRNFKEGFKENSHEFNLQGKRGLVTGGTSGIGRAVALKLSELGANITITGRNLERAQEVINSNQLIDFLQLDMGQWSMFNHIDFSEKLDYLVLNAGAMPSQYTLNESGVELQAASQLIGHLKLMELLRHRELIDRHTRIIWVSSGGMYLKKLDLKNLLSTDHYDKVATYANVKRAQVTLVEELVGLSQWKDWSIYSMHPGWVKTSGLDGALPGFVSLMNKRLRSPEQGADTIIWLCLTKSSLVPGGFYFDRKRVSPYISKKYIPSKNEREELVKASSC